MQRHSMPSAVLVLLAVAVVHAPRAVRAADAAAGAAPPGKAQITVDTTDAPEMAEYAKKVQAVADEWYPKLAALLPSDGYTAPQKVTITFKKDYKGVAATMGDRIVCATKWFTEHPEDLGAIVHELAHVVQRYRGGQRQQRPPGWLVEGIADYVRFFHYEPAKARPRPDPRRAKYTDSYRTSAHFLDWAQATYDKDLVIKLNAACREGKYSDEIWKQLTGKTADEMGEAWKASLAKR